jgi:hypothetical protein
MKQLCLISSSRLSLSTLSASYQRILQAKASMMTPKTMLTVMMLIREKNKRSYKKRR